MRMKMKMKNHSSCLRLYPFSGYINDKILSLYKEFLLLFYKENIRFNWLAHGKSLSPIKKSGRKMFDVRKNNESILFEDVQDRKCTTPTRIRYEPVNMLDGSIINYEKRSCSNIRSGKFDQQSFYEKLIEKDREIEVLKKGFLNVIEKIKYL